MVTAGRRKSIAFVIVLGVGMISVILLLYIGWVLLNWKHGILLGLSVLLLLMILSGVAINTIFLVREIRRNEQHDAFINAVTHELKTPVASIRLYLQTLQTRAVEEPRRQEFYRIMIEDSDRLLTTIEQILRTGRMGAARRPLNLSRIEIHGLVQQCVERARAVHHLEDGCLNFEAGEPLTFVGDEDEVRAAVANLIDNAVKYSGKEVHVTVEVTQANGRLAVRVTDRGPGLPQSELTQIFKRFYRVPGQMASKVKGTGLGLYIVRSVAKRHGGRAWAESEGLGKGSMFVVEFPMVQ
jgi:two-component system, OmpR family, sensor histidine kinase SenX3